MEKSVGQVISILFNFYEKQQQSDRIKLYTQMFHGVDPELLWKACNKCVQTLKYLPSVAEINEQLTSLVSEATGERKKDWDEVWKEIYKGLQNGFPYSKQPEWSTPEIAELVNAYGWVNFYSMETKNEPIIFAQLRNMYDAICKRKINHETNQNVLEGRTGFEKIGDLIPKIEGGKKNE